jgi:hypothetical protein
MKPQQKRKVLLELERSYLSFMWWIWILAFGFCASMFLAGVVWRVWEWPLFIYFVCILGLIWLRYAIDGWAHDLGKRFEEEQNNQKENDVSK